MSTVILILAAGKAFRGWTEKTPKQLAMIAGEPLILRTLRMLEERGYSEGIVITHIATIQNAVPKYFVPKDHIFWYQTLYSTRTLWGDRNIILNGDTIYSPEVIDTILADQTGLMFYGKLEGNMSHINAMSFNKKNSERVTNAAIKTIKERLRQRGGRLQHNWGLYHVLFGLPLRKRNAPGKVWCAQSEDDYTCDIDTPESYAKFLKRHKWARGRSGR